MAKNLAINHFLLEALAAFQDCGRVTFSGLQLTMKNLMVTGCKENQFYSLPEGPAVTNIY